jgi:hypothetical protein
METEMQKMVTTFIFKDLSSNKIGRLEIDNTIFYLGKTLRIACDGVRGFKKGESVWIIRLRDPKIFKKFIMVSNKINVVWLSLEDIFRT